MHACRSHPFSGRVQRSTKGSESFVQRLGIRSIRAITRPIRTADQNRAVRRALEEGRHLRGRLTGGPGMSTLRTDDECETSNW